MAEADTIAAVATALGEASVGIVRVSGSDASRVVKSIFRTPSNVGVEVSKRQFKYGLIVDPWTQEVIDECILLWMPGPHSYTAEDVAEFQVHGGIQVLQKVLECTLKAGARTAEPGEFTKRAFLNGRIDLSQAEAVMDLIRSKTDKATQSALSQVRGYLSDSVGAMRRELLTLQAQVEVTIDYPEHDVESVACAQVVEVGTRLGSNIRELIKSARIGQVLREGVATAILGRPNVGKSSLLNALLRRDRAIVTELPGTTRDVLEEYVNVRGIPFRLIDTAGIRETEDVVEQIGVTKSREFLETAELVFVLINGNEPLQQDDLLLLSETRKLHRIIVVNKSDLPQAVDEGSLRGLAGDSAVVKISAKEHDGLGALEDEMERLVLGGSVEAADLTYMANARQKRLLEDAESELQEAVAAAQMGVTLDMIAVQLQSAYASLGLVVGEEVGEELLDEIFSRFCLGK
ncbi:tRNA uridine-5-carboxymethylaminomethyl(34) synthesis GTPase MnmE [Alicyclobacillus sp. SO9]|nr:tRNA uridine-5-carboxymethylaminomethyl(34) synthesis GTPase MnmE [Alicyclobacillus sp. SO9]